MNRRNVSIVLAGLAALAASGLAAASLGEAQGTTPVAATLTAGLAGGQTQTCAGADGTYATASALWTGTAASADARLTGKLTIRAKSVVNTTSHYGWTVGKLEVRDAVTGALKAKANLTAVVTRDGTLNGFLLGRLHGPDAALLANVSGSLGPDGTTLTGHLGSDANASSAIAFGGTGCGKSEKGKHGGRKGA